MRQHALDVLEFERVLERVARRASSELGRDRVRALRPGTERAGIVRELARVAAEHAGRWAGRATCIGRPRARGAARAARAACAAAG